MGIQELLRNRRVRHECVWHRPECSSSRRAKSVGVPGGRVAKSVLVRAGTGYVLAVLPSTCRIDWARLAGALCCPEMRLATEEEVAEVFHDCERGALPPFGRLYGVPTVVDSSLAGGCELVVEGNLRHLDVKLRYADFEAIERPIRARFAEPVAPRRRPEGRRAG